MSRLDLAGKLVAGRFHMKKCLGGGAMGEVWLAEDTTLGREVAVKFMTMHANDSAKNSDNRERFLREARSAARISRNPHVVTVYDIKSGEEDGLGFPCIMMEYVPGGRTLKDEEEEQGRFTVSQTVRVMGDVLDGLAAAHQQDVIHRDVKPANIMHNDNGDYQLTDFGLAKSTDSGVSQYESRTADDPVVTLPAGTITYMPPEAFQGKSDGLEKQGDVYAAGIVFWELVAGQNPVEGPENENQWARLMRRAQFAVPRLATVYDGVPVTFSDFVARLTAFDPSGRPSDAVVALREFRDLQAQLTPVDLAWRAAADVTLDEIRAAAEKEAEEEKSATEADAAARPFPNIAKNITNSKHGAGVAGAGGGQSAGVVGAGGGQSAEKQGAGAGDKHGAGDTPETTDTPAPVAQTPEAQTPAAQTPDAQTFAAQTPSMTSKEVNAFIKKWTGRGHEDSESQQFWFGLLRDVIHVPYDVADPEDGAFERHTDDNGRIDLLVRPARVLIEMKGANLDLDKPELRQKELKTPLRQAADYVDGLNDTERPRFVVTCNFKEFRVYDLNSTSIAKLRRDDGTEKNRPAPDATFTLDHLEANLPRLRQMFIPADTGASGGVSGGELTGEVEKVNVEAARLVARIHAALAVQYPNPDEEEAHRQIALITMRLVFLMYAQDAGLLPADAFDNLLQSNDPEHLRRALMDLFTVVDTPVAARDPFLEKSLAQFPYIDGGLYREALSVPPFTEETRAALINASAHFDWRTVSPVVFGSLMEETLSHDQRRMGGMHYTTVRNIHRVIDPLFLDDLTMELDHIEAEVVSENTHRKHLTDYQSKLASLQFLDPACGSGNFLTESYICLRRLENRVLSDLGERGALDLGDEINPIRVKIDQFHGIEINDFAVSVARTALWIAEQQMLDESEAVIGAQPRLPLHDANNIVCANALRYDWNTLLPGEKCDYVMGNPPFIGQYLKSDEQTEDMKLVWGKDYDGYLDYATCWHRKASQYLTKPGAQFAFVSTNSITQGQPVPALFQPLARDGWRIRFAHRTFAWDAQSSDMAHVHVVIIGMTRAEINSATLYEYPDINGEPVKNVVDHINGYLVAGPDVYVEKRSQKQGTLNPSLNLCYFGSKAIDGGNLILATREQYDEAMADPVARKYVRPYLGALELIRGVDRWCLWLWDAQPEELRKSAFLKKHIEACKAYRENAPKTGDAYKFRGTPWLFRDDHNPREPYLAVPRVFSETREWMTCMWLDPSTVASDQLYVCNDPDGFAFAIIESRMFLTWQKGIGGRLESRCRFSNTVVWNTLPLPTVDESQRAAIIAAGRQILAARANHPGSSLADLYDPTFMPADLRKAHENLDRLVDVAFGAKKWLDTNDDARLTILFDNYIRLTTGK